MSNKKNQDQKNRDAVAEMNEAILQTDYIEYVARIENRILAGEILAARPYGLWVRTATRKDKDGNEFQIKVSGDTGETKKEKFKRLIDSRMSKVLNDLDLIMNLSSPQYEPYDTEKIVNALRLKVLDIENSFKAQVKEEVEKFSL